MRRSHQRDELEIVLAEAIDSDEIQPGGDDVPRIVGGARSHDLLDERHQIRDGDAELAEQLGL